MNESKFVVGAASDVGKVREINEDAHGYLRATMGEFLVVCDGMGGHASGDVASKVARDAAMQSVLAAQGVDAGELLRQAVAAAHARVRHTAASAPDKQGMGTTIVCALVQGTEATVANVGDSRAYIVRNGQAQQVSTDHTKGQQLLQNGVITLEQLAAHPQKGVLYMALGQLASEPVPAVVQFQLLEGDYLVLCSDGVYDCLTLDKLGELSAGINPAYAAANLVRYAVERDGKDNATVVIGRAHDVDKPVAAPVPLQPQTSSGVHESLGPPPTAAVAAKKSPGWLMLLLAGAIGLIAGGVAGHWWASRERTKPAPEDAASKAGAEPGPDAGIAEAPTPATAEPAAEPTVEALPRHNAGTARTAPTAPPGKAGGTHPGEPSSTGTTTRPAPGAKAAATGERGADPRREAAPPPDSPTKTEKR